MITKKDLIKEIKRQNRAIKKGKQSYFNFLGFVEKDKLSDDIEGYFKEYINGVVYYNWIDGNESLKELIKEVLK